MSDLTAESQSEAKRLTEPASDEAEILAGNAAREEATAETKSVASEIKGNAEKLEEPKKLSAADFRVYNSMAEHMEYFVRVFALSRRRKLVFPGIY